jgi:hypothetical protein
MMDVLLIDFRQMLEEKLAQSSEDNTLVVIYLENRHATLGALIQLLQINLSDILLGKASTKQMDVLILTFPDRYEALDVFQKLVRGWDTDHNEEQIHIQLWHQGTMETEDVLGLETIAV